MKWKISSQRFFSVKFTQIFSPLQRSTKPWCFSSETQQVSLKTFFLCLGLERISVKYFLSSQSKNLSHLTNLNLHWQNHQEIFQIASLQRWNKWNSAHYLRFKWIYFPWYLSIRFYYIFGGLNMISRICFMKQLVDISWH